MPFTFAHPAIVLPFGLIKKKWFSLTGLIIGSMSPDFEYFFRMHIRSDYSHTIPGLFYFDLPASLLIALVFHQVIKPALLPNLPGFLVSRFSHFAEFNWLNYLRNNFSVVVISILFGAFSHIFWDGFTHINGYFVKHFLALRYMEIAGFPLYKILQHSSTILGLFVIILVINSLPKSKLTEQTKANHISFWLITFVSAAIILSIYLFFQNSFPATGNLIVASISAGFIGLFTASVISYQNIISK